MFIIMHQSNHMFMQAIILFRHKYDMKLYGGQKKWLLMVLHYLDDSTSQDDFIALGNCSCRHIWLFNFVTHGYGISLMTHPVYCSFMGIVGNQELKSTYTVIYEMYRVLWKCYIPNCFTFYVFFFLLIYMPHIFSSDGNIRNYFRFFNSLSMGFIFTVIFTRPKKKRSRKTEDEGKGTTRKDFQYSHRVPIILLKINLINQTFVKSWL